MEPLKIKDNAMRVDLTGLQLMAQTFLEESSKNGRVGAGMPVHPYVILAMIDRIESAESELAVSDADRNNLQHTCDMQDLKLGKLELYFTSTNGVEVDRATILAKDFWNIVHNRSTRL